MRRVLIPFCLIAVAALPCAAFGLPPALFTTAGLDADHGLLVFPKPEVGLPAPEYHFATGLPSGARPHGIDVFEIDRALIADFGNYRLLLVDPEGPTLLATVPLGMSSDLTNTDGSGSVAVDPTGAYALTAGTRDAQIACWLSVVHAPFGPSSTIDRIELPGLVKSYEAHAIVFDSAGRAYVYQNGGISVLDPPYSSISFSTPFSHNAGGIAITPDGNHLLSTHPGTSAAIQIWDLPLTALSTPQQVFLPEAQGIDGIVVNPDGEEAYAISSGNANNALYVLHAPFSSSSTLDVIPLSSDFGTFGFEDLAVSPDGRVVIAAGNGDLGDGIDYPVAVIEAPFTVADATVYQVDIGVKRGNGSVRFPPTLFADGFESGDDSRWVVP